MRRMIRAFQCFSYHFQLVLWHYTRIKKYIIENLNKQNGQRKGEIEGEREETALLSELISVLKVLENQTMCCAFTQLSHYSALLYYSIYCIL